MEQPKSLLIKLIVLFSFHKYLPFIKEVSYLIIIDMVLLYKMIKLPYGIKILIYLNTLLLFLQLSILVNKFIQFNIIIGNGKGKIAIVFQLIFIY